MPDAMPWILGIGSSHNGAACLLHGPEIVAAVQEERLLRYKRADHPGAFPSLAVAYCLDQAGIRPSQLDAVVLCFVDSARARQDDIYLNPQLRVAHHGVRAFTIPHHFGHAVAAYALSGLASAGLLVIDGTGSPWDEMLESERAAIVPGQIQAWNVEGRRTPREIISLYAAVDGVITPLEKHIASYPSAQATAPGMPEFRSLGDMYGAVGQQIFGSPLDGAGKVMGLAPYGTPTIPVEAFYRITPLGLEFQDAVRCCFAHDERWPSHKQEYGDLAASVQRALEVALLHLCARLRDTNSNLCYAGGVALNSVANNRIVNEAGFRDVFIMPAAEDSGTAIGAAYYGLWQLCGYARRARQEVDNPGRVYADHEITAALDHFPGLRAARTPAVVEDTAELLAQGKIVGWFQGGSELGPRALGQRSILCDPRPRHMKDTLNQRVKFREAFRPFAPIIPEEQVDAWFEVDRTRRCSPFMLRVMPFRPEQAARVPAVVHVDGTGRVQTVSRHTSPRLHQLLTEFEHKTGVPILLNTSFNIAGEPIVESPADAMWCFLYSDMDYCIVGDHLLSKHEGLDCVLNSPLCVTARSFFTYGGLTTNGASRPAIDELRDAGERLISAHAARAEEIPVAARVYRWLRLLVVVSSPWGDMLHGLPGGLLHILRLIDGQATGMEIYDRLTDGAQHEYSTAAFRRHIGLLKRIGAIGFTGSRVR